MTDDAVAPSPVVPSPVAPSPEVYDVAVIGGGVVGTAVLRALAGYELSVVLLEARGDVGDVTSKANTAILHTGFDAVPGSLESRMVARGYALLSEFAAAWGIPVERIGALLVAWTPEELAALPGLKAKAEQNGYVACELVDAAEVYRREPHLGPGALGGLTVPDEAIICPWTTTLAFATDALQRGAELRLNARVTAAAASDGTIELATGLGPVRARWVVNAAGLGSDLVDGWFGGTGFTIEPRRGQLIVFDKVSRSLVNSIVLPVPTALGKGVLISPTIYGNVMLGPTAEPLTDRTDTSTSAQGLEFLQDKGRRILPELLAEEVTATYAGLRAATEHSDYVVRMDADQHYLCLGGIRSTGLTASLALAEQAIELLGAAGLPLTPRPDVPAPLVMPNLGQASVRPYEDAQRIDADPAYGTVICFCERVTLGEIRDAYASAIPPVDVDGLRRRTRALMGRCQGFYCGAKVEQLMAEFGEPPC